MTLETFGTFGEESSQVNVSLSSSLETIVQEIDQTEKNPENECFESCNEKDTFFCDICNVDDWFDCICTETENETKSLQNEKTEEDSQEMLEDLSEDHTSDSISEKTNNDKEESEKPIRPMSPIPFIAKKPMLHKRSRINFTSENLDNDKDEDDDDDYKANAHC